jgi:hypothetical protein
MLCLKSNISVPVSLYWYIISVTKDTWLWPKIVKSLIDVKNIVTHADDSDSEFECDIH